MYVLFDMDEPTVLRIQQLIREGKFKSVSQSDKVPVNIGLTNEGDQHPHPAVVDFVDNKVDPATGTLKVRAVVPNPVVANGDRLFSSGMFVRVQVPLGEPQRQLLVTEVRYRQRPRAEVRLRRGQAGRQERGRIPAGRRQGDW